MLPNVFQDYSDFSKLRRSTHAGSINLCLLLQVGRLNIELQPSLEC